MFFIRWSFFINFSCVSANRDTCFVALRLPCVNLSSHTLWLDISFSFFMLFSWLHEILLSIQWFDARLVRALDSSLRSDAKLNKLSNRIRRWHRAESIIYSFSSNENRLHLIEWPISNQIRIASFHVPASFPIARFLQHFNWNYQILPMNQLQIQNKLKYCATYA